LSFPSSHNFLDQQLDKPQQATFTYFHYLYLLVSTSISTIYHQVNRKISAIASILAFLVATPFSAVATTTYTCNVDAGYEIEDDESNPTYPTTSEKNWAAGRLKTSYQALHTGGDFSMPSITVDNFTLDGQRLNDKNNKNVRTGSGALHMFDALLWSSSSIACNLCGSWDDDDAAADGAALEETAVTKKEADWLADYYVKATTTHALWVAAFCDELQHGPAVFKYAENCQITLYDCTTSASTSSFRNNDEHEMEVDKIHEGEEAAMVNEDIEMDVDASRH
jgi:hypothetical protein